MDNFIQRYCKITNGKAIVNGNKLFSSGKPVNEFLDEFYTFLNLNYPKFYKMDKLSKLGFLASEILLQESELKSFDAFEVSVVLSNSASSLDTDKNYFESTKTVASPALFVYTLPNIVNGEICIRHGLKGESSFFVTPQFDAKLLYSYCNELLQEKSKLCMAGWVEVMNESYGAFLYLVGRKASGQNQLHTTENITLLYSA